MSPVLRYEPARHIALAAASGARMDLNDQLETQVACIVAYLRGELGYDTESPGSLRRQIEEHDQMIRTIDDTLRGRGGDLGVVGWMMVLRRSWITLVALLGAAFGYLLNDVMHTLKPGGRAASAASTSSQR